ncbi:hypothetical protein NBO_1591g0001 [Nosema bombycis CQ1]|uniref:Uncharacterized protein n=1 Tax=Nosema bombycis (strain CQ1 / CVCC 102059) TaxID=578461 RepID=R0MEC7_NOSB1|nr:hypothetical protein NBO_1591g0001 [Nosema bombycis CQ1]|eukprot:EOB11143.1 hypothetical protein NBO_1591g0001 [Nosema bombycis CQ1]
MDFMFIIIIYFTFSVSIITSDSKDMFKKVDKNRLDLNITKYDRNITVKFKSKEHIPFGGIWTSDNFTIDDSQFLIEGTSIFEWVTINITDINSLDRFIDTISSRTFEHKSNIKGFYDKADNLQLALVIFKIEDFRKIAVKVIKSQKSSGSKSSSDDFDHEIEKNMLNMQIIHVLNYNNKANKIPSDLNDYELYILKSFRMSDSFKTLPLLKKCAFDVITSAALAFTFFGILILTGRYSLSKFF